MNVTRTLLILALLPAFTGLRAAAAVIAVYHTSDAHGWYSARPARWDNENPNRPIGGFAALSALLKQETAPYLLLDSGDMFQGTPEGILTKGMASIMLMNQLDYAAAVPGNHDYDYGEPNLKVLVSSAAFPFLGANLYQKAGGAHADYLKPYTFIEKDGRRIAVLGTRQAYRHFHPARQRKTPGLPRRGRRNGEMAAGDREAEPGRCYSTGPHRTERRPRP